MLQYVSLVGLMMAVLIRMAFAQPQPIQRFYDEAGRQVGRSEQQDRVTRFYDADGRLRGRDERSSDGVIRQYDQNGKLIGTIRR